MLNNVLEDGRILKCEKQLILNSEKVYLMYYIQERYLSVMFTVCL